MSLSLSECYEFNGTCDKIITVLDQLLVPIKSCPLLRGYKNSGKLLGFFFFTFFINNPSDWLICLLTVDTLYSDCLIFFLPVDTLYSDWLICFLSVGTLYSDWLICILTVDNINSD